MSVELDANGEPTSFTVERPADWDTPEGRARRVRSLQYLLWKSRFIQAMAKRNLPPVTIEWPDDEGGADTPIVVDGPSR